MPTETTAAARWLYGVLSGDAALAALCGGRVFAYRVPIGKPMPCVVFQMQGARPDSRPVGASRVASRMAFVVKAVSQGADLIAIRPIADRIDRLIEAAGGTNVDGVVAQCVRETPVEYLELGDNGVDYAHLGGLYRLTVVGA
ncbi:MAG: DUF3168 domain-containing protein [Fimbriimonas ginsengisoli]|uniref:DUF3168 domain-containing protein n=1 Tax=Fimbriimonas ginsengisoli TaxID=1005039 RepID=A0A931LUQ9_FIMGI|nr:DUF3168 domain-containing protein [Fimbriimonas ginsengisoli]